MIYTFLLCSSFVKNCFLILPIIHVVNLQSGSSNTSIRTLNSLLQCRNGYEYFQMRLFWQDMYFWLIKNSTRTARYNERGVVRGAPGLQSIVPWFDSSRYRLAWLGTKKSWVFICNVGDILLDYHPSCWKYQYVTNTGFQLQITDHKDTHKFGKWKRRNKKIHSCYMTGNHVALTYWLLLVVR